MSPVAETDPDPSRPADRLLVMLNAALESMLQGFSIWDDDLRLILWNRRYLDTYGLGAERFYAGMPLIEVCEITIEAGNHPGKTAADLFATYRDRLVGCAGPGTAQTYDKAIRDRTIRTTYQRRPGLGWVVIHEDITEEKRQVQALLDREKELEHQNMRFEAAVNNMSQGLCMFDADHRLIICNRRYADLYGMPPELVRPGTTLEEILDHRIARGVVPKELAEAYVASRLEMAAGGKEVIDTAQLQDGRIIAVRHHPMPDRGWVATHEDITEQRRTESRIRHLARHDGLTDLPNRLLFRERMELAEARMRRGEVMAVLFVDLDHFKSVNDLFGHGIGDAVLRDVAARLRRVCRGSDAVARLGGDEFAVLHGPLAAPEDAAALADCIVKAMAEPLDFDGHRILTGASVGIAVGPHDGADAETLMRNADLALYRAKADGRGAYHFFEPGMDAALQQRLAFELELRSALANGELELVYQPLLSLDDNRISCLEALLRWRHPTRGVVMPATIIPIAEESGLIAPIGAWVLRQACAAASEWPAHVRVAVNLSPVQFKHRDLVEHVAAALKSSGIDPHRLEIEITESVFIADGDLIVKTLHRIRALGVRIAMDDFGTGCSSLGQLRAFPFDKIKIDQSFVRDMSSREDSLAIVKAMIGLGRSLGLETTVEGVETEDQLDIVRGEGCTEVQGFLFSPPLPASSIGKLLGADAGATRPAGRMIAP